MLAIGTQVSTRSNKIFATKNEGNEFLNVRYLKITNVYFGKFVSGNTEAKMTKNEGLPSLCVFF